MDPQLFVQLQNLRIVVIWMPAIEIPDCGVSQCEGDENPDLWERGIVIEERIPADVFGHEQWAKVDREDRPYVYEMAGLLLDQAGYKKTMPDVNNKPPTIKEINND